MNETLGRRVAFGAYCICVLALRITLESQNVLLSAVSGWVALFAFLVAGILIAGLYFNNPIPLIKYAFFILGSALLTIELFQVSPGVNVGVGLTAIAIDLLLIRPIRMKTAS